MLWELLHAWVLAANPGRVSGDHGGASAAQQPCLSGNGCHTALQGREHPRQQHVQQNQ